MALQEIFNDLDASISKMNREFRREGTTEIPRFYIQVLGQMALLEAEVDLTLFATADLDAYANFVWLAKDRFKEILRKHGKTYDELSNEIWMPDETEYDHIFKGDSFDGYVAKPEYILVSKALMAPVKNGSLIAEYLAGGASQKFYELANQYSIDLREFVLP